MYLCDYHTVLAYIHPNCNRSAPQCEAWKAIRSDHIYLAPFLLG